MNQLDRGGGGQRGLNVLAREFRPASSGAGEKSNVGDTSKSIKDCSLSKSNKKRKSQARQDRWHARNKSDLLRKKYRAFNRGAKKFYSKLKASHDELRAASGAE